VVVCIGRLLAQSPSSSDKTVSTETKPESNAPLTFTSRSQLVLSVGLTNAFSESHRNSAAIDFS